MRKITNWKRIILKTPAWEFLWIYIWISDVKLWMEVCNIRSTYQWLKVPQDKVMELFPPWNLLLPYETVQCCGGGKYVCPTKFVWYMHLTLSLGQGCTSISLSYQHIHIWRKYRILSHEEIWRWNHGLLVPVTQPCIHLCHKIFHLVVVESIPEFLIPDEKLGRSAAFSPIILFSSLVYINPIHFLLNRGIRSN